MNILTSKDQTLSDISINRQRLILPEVVWQVVWQVVRQWMTSISYSFLDLKDLYYCMLDG